MKPKKQEKRELWQILAYQDRFKVLPEKFSHAHRLQRSKLLKGV